MMKMSATSPSPAQDDAIAAEQIRAFCQESGAQNLAGIVVLGLIAAVAAPQVPIWTWAPGAFVAFCATLFRGSLVHGYNRWPERHSTETWGRLHTLGSAINGAAWGYANTAMSAHLPLTYELFIATVAAVSASAAASEGFGFFRPSWAFIATSLSPLAVWYLMGSDDLHVMLGAMLTIYIPLLLWQGEKRHKAFVESLQLRFHNEFLAQELARQRALAEDASRAKARFLAAASHDLRQPVQALAIFLDLMRQEMNITARGEEYFAKSRQALKALSSLLGTLLNISRLDSNTVTPQPRPVCIGDVFGELLQEFTEQATQKGLTLRIVPCAARTETDPVLFGQILRNLVSNAIRYTLHGRVLVGCRRRGDRLSVEVWDTGIGIDEAARQRVFDEFFQVGNAERDRQKGLGLGLAIASRAARLLGTQIELRSEPGRGSCFSVSLPRSFAPLPEQPVAPAAVSYDLTGKRVVVVDNEEAIREGLHNLLEQWGCDVVSGISGGEVLQRLGENPSPVDAVISDYSLPGPNSGIDVIGQLRERLGDGLPALLITGDTSRDVMQAADKAGVPILHKPVKPWALRHKLAAMLNPAVPAQSA